MSAQELEKIMKRLDEIESARVAGTPSWWHVLVPLATLTCTLIAWGVTVESRMATFRVEIDQRNGLFQEIKADQKEILQRLRAIEVKVR